MVSPDQPQGQRKIAIDAKPTTLQGQMQQLMQPSSKRERKPNASSSSSSNPRRT